MDLATGAMGSLLPKLVDLLKEEYNLQKGVRKDGEFLENELRSINAALGAVGEVPWYQLDEQVRVWADEVRELSYTMEDVVDSFLVRVDGPDPVSKPKKVKWLKEKIGDLRSLFTKGKTRHQIGDKIKDIKKKVNEVAERRRRYELDGLVTKPTAATKIDPRVWALYTDVTELVGIDGKRDLELINLLDGGDPNNKLKVVSVVGFGGLGKTTLVQAVYKKIKSAFDSSAFVPVGRSADVKKVLRDILFDLKCSNNDLEVLDERQLIDQVRTFLENKRYVYTHL
jgi:disease resistance protein RPM1